MIHTTIKRTSSDMLPRPVSSYQSCLVNLWRSKCDTLRHVKCG